VVVGGCLSGGPLQLKFPGLSLMRLNIKSELRLGYILERIMRLHVLEGLSVVSWING
jgi:hypothetical protein